MLHIFLLTNFLLLFDKFSLVFVAESFNISLLLFVFQLLWCHMRKASVSGSGLTEGKFILSFAWLLERILTKFTHAFFQFSLISISPAFLAHCVTTYFLLVFFKLPLTLLLLQNISCRIPLRIIARATSLFFSTSCPVNILTDLWSSKNLGMCVPWCACMG